MISSIAAFLLVLIMASVYLFKDTSHDNTISQVESKKIITKSKNKKVATEDIVTTQSKDLAINTNTALIQKKEQLSDVGKSDIVTNNTTIEEEVGVNTVELIAKPILKEQADQVVPDFVIEGILLDSDSNAPISDGIITDFNTNKKVKTDFEGKFKMKVESNTMNAIVQQPSYEDKGTILSINEQNTIYLAPKSKVDKNKVIPKENKAKVSPPSKEFTTGKSFYPVFGYDILESFIERNKNIQLEAFQKNFHGAVEINFTINPDGSLSDFKSDNVECEQCVIEAIRLLKKSGKWATIPKGETSKGDYKISF